MTKKLTYKNGATGKNGVSGAYGANSVNGAYGEKSVSGAYGANSVSGAKDVSCVKGAYGANDISDVNTKYSGIDAGVAERIRAEMAKKYEKPKDAAKAVKRELHIIYGAFLTKENLRRARALIGGYAGADIYADKKFAAELLSLHASTSERRAEAEAIYAYIGEHITPEDAVADIGCGFNPFALPYYKYRPAGYAAYDICASTVSLINEYFSRLGPAYAAHMLDAAVRTPRAANTGSVNDGDGGDVKRGDEGTSDSGDGAVSDVNDAAVLTPHTANSCDSGHAGGVDDSAGASYIAGSGRNAEKSADNRVVLLMLKLAPLLERQKRGRTNELLCAAGCRAAIVSFPTKSASGRDVGMEAFYSEQFERNLPGCLSVADKTIFSNEMFYVINKK